MLAASERDAVTAKWHSAFRIVIPNTLNQGKHCLSFAYHMFGHHTGTLSVVRVTQTGDVTPWSISGNQENQWFRTSLELSAEDGDMIGFIGELTGYYSSDIALDAIELRAGTCP